MIHFSSFLNLLSRNILAIGIFSILLPPAGANNPAGNKSTSRYTWTTDHMQFGVRWQPFAGRPENNLYDANRPVLSKYSSYAQFWMNWAAAEPRENNTNYRNAMSGYLKAIDQAVNICASRGIKVEFVMWHCPAWASESGKAGPWRPKSGKYAEFVTRLARHFKGRVGAYQPYHEVNMQSMINDADIDFVMSEIFLRGAQAIRAVYAEKPAKPVIISTSGTSPCEPCGVLKGLKGGGAVAVDDFYNRLIANKPLMAVIDALNLNVSDHANGYGRMDGKIIPNVWTQYDLARRKLDMAGYHSKKILSSESWVVWDNSRNNHDINKDGKKDERDAFDKSVTIIGKMLERGLNTINLPWSDNSSPWSMGLTKRHDYNGRIKKLNPDIVIPARGGGPDIVTAKVALGGADKNLYFHRKIRKEENDFSVKNFIDPSDPNHLHYYVWRWYSQIAGGSDEVIRHAIAGEVDNDINISGLGNSGKEKYKIASFNRTKSKFTVLVYSGGADGSSRMKVTIPSTIQKGNVYNNSSSLKDFRGEGFADGDKYQAIVVTKNISRQNGSDQKVSVQKGKVMTVANGTLQATVGNIRKFTSIEFVKVQ